MTYEELLDEWCYISCGDCKHCTIYQDMDGYPQTCKRIDHKHYTFAKPTFKSYDCSRGCICSDFEPKERCVWLYNNWQPEFINDYIDSISDDATMDMNIDHNWEVRYVIRKKDFVLNNFTFPDGSLKWLRKEYYKQSRQSPTGYKYVCEYPDGYKTYGANTPIDKNHVQKGIYNEEN